MVKIAKNELVFCPLGGVNEIGMNANLYHLDGKWILIDLGAGFADERYPGVSLLMPDISFIETLGDNFLGVVCTHAHEDHIGAISYLWEDLQCPIYATKFTAEVVKNKLKQLNLDDRAEITIQDPGSRFNVGPFDLEMVQITHSIPEMNGIIMRTKHGNIMHTGDWKIDPNPVIAPTTDEVKLKALGKEGVLALVCDSTNIFTEKHSGSEGDLEENMVKLLQNRSGAVFISTFASNVARVDTIARVAKRLGRKVLLAGWSLKRITQAARDSGYLQDADPFLHEKQFKNQKREELLVLCTGCQGEEMAAMSRIIFDSHPDIRLKPKDAVMFSSKIIPGNDKKIFRMLNHLSRRDIATFTEKDHHIHVSGHPSRPEVQKMYEWVKPEIAVPVHGEAVHLKEHAAFAQSLGIKQQFILENGDVLRLAPNPKKIGRVKSGYWAMDGYELLPDDSDVMKKRQRLQNEGIIFISFLLKGNKGLSGNITFDAPGVVGHEDQAELYDFLKEEIQSYISDMPAVKVTEKNVRRFIHKLVRDETGKNPMVEIAIHRA